MTIRVLIVDDSSFICKRIEKILSEDYGFKVVGVASNGKQALLMAAQLEPDVITMDVEMPVMDGISAVKKIMAECPTAILMFSSATHRGAQATLDALNAGAIDFLPKELDQIDGDREKAKRVLRRSVRIVASQTKTIKSKSVIDYAKPASLIKPRQAEKIYSPVRSKTVYKKIELLTIVASTGGPVAIQKLLRQLSSNCPFPILIVQHMPHNFTKSFADRLNQLCMVHVKEAENGDELQAGQALLAPGGMQMEVQHRNSQKIVKIREKLEMEIYSPSADLTLSSISDVYSNDVLAVVLTGMGSDGREGAMKLKSKGSAIWAQDEASCTIYGMPKAIVEANLADFIYSLDDMENEFKTIG